MSSARIQINELRLRVSGLTREQAQRLGETVAKRLADTKLDSKSSRRIPTLTLRVASGVRPSMDHLVDEIASGIRGCLD